MEKRFYAEVEKRFYAELEKRFYTELGKRFLNNSCVSLGTYELNV
ncbi:MAG: hypothetical protein WAV55_11290 [Clostridiaceae bacterium]